MKGKYPFIGSERKYIRKKVEESRILFRKEIVGKPGMAIPHNINTKLSYNSITYCSTYIT